ncbi:MAG: MFS transporter [Propionibacteriaceae bacterium]|nr:MFS transporter [Propionibacteriaceae bacterium]
MDAHEFTALHRLMAASLFMNLVGQASFVCIVLVLSTHASPTVLGLALGTTTLIDAVVSPFGGWLADRFPRPRMVIVGVSIEILCYLSLATLTGFRPDDVVLVFALMVLAQVGESITLPASGTLAPTIFVGDALGVANARIQTMSRIGSVCGPLAMSAIMLATGRVWFAFVANAIILAVARWNTVDLMRRFPATNRVSEASSPAAGATWRHVLAHPVIGLLVLYYLITQAGAGTLWVGLPVLAAGWHDRLITYPVLVAAGSIGGLIGAWCASRFTGKAQMVRNMALFTLAQAVCVVLVGVIRVPMASVGLYAMYALCVSLSGVVVMTYIGTSVDNRLLGRATGVTDSASIGGFAVGNYGGGPLVAHAGAAAAFIGCGITSVVGAVLLLAHRPRQTDAVRGVAL